VARKIPNILVTLGVAGALTLGGAAQAEWQPRKSVEFVATAGGGGGTDQFARTVQAIITKHKLMEQPVTVVNKPGGSGAEGFIYGKGAKGDPHKLIFGTSNEWTLPLVAKLAFKPDDLTPLAAMVLDEFLIWVGNDAPYKTVSDFIAAAKQAPLKMGGSNSKDTDQTLTRLIERTTGAKFTYIPYKSGGEAAVQLAGGHVDSNTNNPAENIAQWRGAQGRPLCVFSAQRMPHKTKVTETMSWADIPTCKESGLPIETFQQPRTVFLPGGVTKDQIEFYTQLFRKVHEAPEWREYLERTAQTDLFLVGDAFAKFIATDVVTQRKQIEAEGWLAN
jgi:putative tricarboxylic transport membrane protein